MGKINTIKDCKRGKDARRLAQRIAAQREDVHYKNGGCHVCVKVEGKGKAPIPRGEWSKGLKSAVIRQWKLLGLAILLLILALACSTTDASARIPEEPLPTQVGEKGTLAHPWYVSVQQNGSSKGRQLVSCTEPEPEPEPEEDWRVTGELVCPDPANPDFCYRDVKVKP